MSVRKTQSKKNTHYFITITCFKWIHLFDVTNLYDNIYEWFNYLKSVKVLLNGYVIMPNHMHLLVYCHQNNVGINKILGNGKRFMAYEIISRLSRLNRVDLLEILSKSVKPNERLKGKLHNTFEPSFDIKEITTEKFFIQKLNYIHQNPVRGNWHLVDDYRLYKHSSAGYYELGQNIGYNVIHYERVLDYFGLQSPC